MPGKMFMISPVKRIFSRAEQNCCRPGTEVFRMQGDDGARRGKKEEAGHEEESLSVEERNERTAAGHPGGRGVRGGGFGWTCGFPGGKIAPEQSSVRTGRKSIVDVGFRFAERKDTALILQFIRELAEYEKLLHEVVADERTLEEWIFDRKKAEVLFALADGREVGFALFFHNFSTFLGRAGIYLEDLYVRPEYRGRGCGKALLKKLAAVAAERGCGRLEWWCLDWNRQSIDFYLSLGAEPMKDWTVYRIAGETLQNLAR